MTVMQASSNSLPASLGEEIEVGNALLHWLKLEQEHLVRGDLDGMIKITEEKSKAVARMTELAYRRHGLLGAAGFDASEAGMQRWVDEADSLTKKAWNELIAIAREAKELNRTNGLVIGQQMARNQNILNGLHGNTQGNGMYGPDGQTSARGVSRKLVVG